MATIHSFFHIYNRGAKKLPLFLRIEDYQRFLEKLRNCCAKLSVCLLAYCIMPNHYHFELGLYNNYMTNIPKMMHALATSYGMYFNKLYKGSGHVFQGTYKIRQISSNSDLIHVSKYIHQNPVEHINTKKWWKAAAYMRKYHWSSYREYLGLSNSQLVNSNVLLDLFGANLQSFTCYTEKKLMKWELSEIQREPSKNAGRYVSYFRAKG